MSAQSKIARTMISALGAIVLSALAVGSAVAPAAVGLAPMDASIRA
ncbi:hypothetical protein G7078_00545 [Sphingomonas sinipercae]|uniref:Uncharacterized protein n=1 Tax=Sphingomonas sinipercae TaxID=2714944 RepID=A0A6G7ZKG2_9SPHN|nr:hypothetical protein [Sphingomonas sinipercae]QIL01423.1 hypothetical protein G7078_00545 [Sphingomonas sinipercae]